MALRLITPPALEPVTLEEVKLQLRVDGSELDTEIASHIRTAREYAEAVLNKAILTQAWELSLDKFPKMPLNLPFPPLQSVESIRITDENSVEWAIPASDYVVDAWNMPGRVLFKSGKSWPNTGLFPVNGVVIRFTCGYTQPELVPEAIKTAVIIHVKLLFEEYEPKDKESMEKARDNLLMPGRIWPV